MLGFGELLSMDDVSARHREWITMTLQAGRQLVQLLDEVGDAARIESRTLSLSLGAVRLDTVIADVLELIRPLAMSCAVRLAAAPAPDGTAFVRADEQRLRQVMLNLLDNAVKYNHPAGAVEVTVTRQPGDRFRICVTDTGRGVAEQDLDPMFRPFERLDAAQAGVTGTGLGLALSRDLTEAMGGTPGSAARRARAARSGSSCPPPSRWPWPSWPSSATRSCAAGPTARRGPCCTSRTWWRTCGWSSRSSASGRR